MQSVLIASSEAVPFVKSGGLGEVTGTLPRELRLQGVDARLILPCYHDISAPYRSRMQTMATFTVTVGWRKQPCTILSLVEDGVPCYFVDNEYYFQRPGLYGHYDDGERFAFFCRSVLEGLPHLDFSPQVIHCHDWHTAMICPLLKTSYQETPFYRDMKTLYTVHNLKYQGIFPKETLDELWGLGWEEFTPERLEFYDQVNCMKGGLLYSDAVSTVSRTYLQEIQQPHNGERLEGVVVQRRSQLYGITNGIDNDDYDPAADPALLVNYDSSNWHKKRQNKEGLQEQLGLTISNEKPLIAIVSRLVEPKGLDLVAHVLYDLMSDDIQLVVMGAGEAQYEHMFQVAAWLYPEKMAYRADYDDLLARRMFAAADLLLMPSRFEPCGLSQLFAMRYGCLPIVRETGGLKETVIPFDQYAGEGNGFSFTDYNAHDMLHTIRYALTVYHNDKSNWELLVKNAMQSDNSWHNAACEYAGLYQQLAPEGENICMQ